MTSAGSDFRLYHSNDLSVLAGLLSNTLQKDFDQENILIPETILIPQPAMKRWLQMALAEQHGIAANMRFLTPGEFVRETLNANGLESAGNIFAADTLRWRLFSVLSDKTQWQQPALQTIAPYLRGSQSEMKAWSLANECASAFEKYQAWRRDWCLAWDRGGSPLDWQAHLWRQVTQGKSHRGQAITEYLNAFESPGSLTPQGLPKRLFVFACLNVSPDVLRFIATAAKAGPLHFFLPSPSKKYWGDVSSLRERLKNPQADVFEQADNPLLQAWGRAGRDFIATLFSNNTVELRGDVDVYVPSDKNTLLARVKNDLLERQSPSVLVGGFDPSDTSLQIHSCHTRLREVQVLHDQLHRLFLKDEKLQARDIAIMAPDIDAYAPFIEAVFGAAKNTSRFIPYRLSDRKLQQSSALTDLFLALLGLPKLELTSNEVLDLLNAPALAKYLGVDDDCQRWWPFWIEQAGARWGLNAAHRQQQGVPAEHLTTWAFALDRLLLGYASGDSQTLKGVAPVPEVEGQALNTLDKLIRGLRLLARHNDYFRHPHTASHWANNCGELLGLLDDSSSANATENAAMQRCRDAVADLLEQCRQAEFNNLIAPEIIRDYFRNALSESDASQNFLSGGATVCRMVPMRQIPFKVICLLGMNEGEMPRSEPPGFIQRLSEEIKSPATRRYGDRSLRDDDRFLFLQLLTAADTVFYLSYCGKNPRDDTERAPSSLISELLDCLVTMHPQQKDFRKEFVLQHPLQVFSSLIENDPRHLRFDPVWQATASIASEADFRFVPSVFGDAFEPQSPTIVDWSAFKKFFRDPPRNFLENRLGLRLEQSEEALAEHESFGNPAGLQRYQLQHAIFNALIADDTPTDAELLTLFRSRALLPSGFSAEAVLYKTLSETRSQAMRFKQWRSGEPGVLPFELPLDRFVLQGSLADVYTNGAARIKFGKMKGKHHLGHGLDALLLSALQSGMALVEFIELQEGRPLRRVRPGHDANTAKQYLNALLEIFSLGLQRPLPFHPDAGFAYVKSKQVQATLFNEIAWAAASKAIPEKSSWWTTALRGQDPFIDNRGQPEYFPNSVLFREASFTIFSACAPEFIGAGNDYDNGDGDDD
ncbi:MAG: exodeoxyribonuclease V subunit gamma [Arenimonas sp.]